MRTGGTHLCSEICNSAGAGICDGTPSTCSSIELYIAIYKRDLHVQVSSASVINVGISFVMLKINQHLRLEIAIRKFFNNGYKKYQNLLWASSVNAAENDWTDWQFLVSQALAMGFQRRSHSKMWMDDRGEMDDDGWQMITIAHPELSAEMS